MIRYAALISCLACGTVIRWDSTPIAHDINGVWLFEYTDTPLSSMEALLIGQARVDDGCLTIDGSIVVWVDARAPDLSDLVVRLQDDDTATVRIGGGQVSFAVNERPTAIADRCSSTDIWFAGTEAPVIDFEEP